jgi:hypothetical protein
MNGLAAKGITLCFFPAFVAAQALAQSELVELQGLQGR